MMITTNRVAGFLKGVGVSMAFMLPGLAAADFGLDVSRDFYTVDTGAGLTFQVRRNDWGTLAKGDIVSLNYQGVEYHSRTRGSHVNAGFDWLYQDESSVEVSAASYGNDYIKVTVRAGELTHYYLARRGYPHIYMATHFTREPNVHNHVRYILRLNSDLVPNGPEPSDIRDTVSFVEARDILALANGETRSKHYSNERLKDWSYIGATGSNVGMWVVRDRHEGGSSGPFYRSLLNQATDKEQQLTYIVNYGEAKTEDFRLGVLNSYTLVVTDGSAPNTNPDTSWFEQVDLQGYVPDSDRGLVAGVGIYGRDSRYEYTVGFANKNAQYWTDASNGFYKSANMLPGDYTMTVYKNELEVYERDVKVEAGGQTLLHSIVIQDDPSEDAAIWRIGDWDGTPLEFLNGDKLTRMHPSDPRIATWDPDDFYVGRDTAADFPAYMWMDVNNHHVISFKLNEEERSSAHTIRVGLTCAFAGGRPRIKVNGWSSPAPSASEQPKTRTLTVGTYRCNNVSYDFEVPASVWRRDPNAWNELTVSVISGSGSSDFLSAGFSIDSIDLLK